MPLLTLSIENARLAKPKDSTSTDPEFYAPLFRGHVNVTLAKSPDSYPSTFGFCAKKPHEPVSLLTNWLDKFRRLKPIFQNAPKLTWVSNCYPSLRGEVYYLPGKNPISAAALEVQIDDEAYNNAAAYIKEKQQGRLAFNIRASNCITFTWNVASTAGADLSPLAPVHRAMTIDGVFDAFLTLARQFERTENNRFQGSLNVKGCAPLPARLTLANTQIIQTAAEKLHLPQLGGL